jgi:hypothetical protein
VDTVQQAQNAKVLSPRHGGSFHLNTFGKWSVRKASFWMYLYFGLLLRNWRNVKRNVSVSLFESLASSFWVSYDILSSESSCLDCGLPGFDGSGDSEVGITLRLWAGQLRNCGLNSGMARDFSLLQKVQTTSGAYLASLSVGTRGSVQWGMKLTTNLHLMLRLRITGTVPILHRMSSWHAQWKSMFFFFFFCFYIDMG